MKTTLVLKLMLHVEVIKNNDPYHSYCCYLYPSRPYVTDRPNPRVQSFVPSEYTVIGSIQQVGCGLCGVGEYTQKDNGSAYF